MGRLGPVPLFSRWQKRLLLLVELVGLWLGLRLRGHLRGHLRRSLLARRLRHWGLRFRGSGILLLKYRLRLLSILLLALPNRLLTRGGRAVPRRLLLLIRGGRWRLLLAR